MPWPHLFQLFQSPICYKYPKWASVIVHSGRSSFKYNLKSNLSLLAYISKDEKCWCWSLPWFRSWWSQERLSLAAKSMHLWLLALVTWRLEAALLPCAVMVSRISRRSHHQQRTDGQLVIVSRQLLLDIRISRKMQPPLFLQNVEFKWTFPSPGQPTVQSESFHCISSFTCKTFQIHKSHICFP